MTKYIYSGFADEVSPVFSEQIKVLKDLGLDQIEPRNIDGTNVSSLTREKALEVASLLRENGIGVSSVGSPIGKQNILEDFGPHFELFKNTVAVAKILGTKRIRMFSFYFPKGEEKTYRKEIFRRLRCLVDEAVKHAIDHCHENQEAIYGDSPEKCLEIMKEFDGSIRAVFDPCNFVVDGFESFPKAYELLHDHIEYMHIKDADAEKCICPAGFGVGGIPEILRLLSDRDTLTLTLEPHLKAFSGLDKLTINPDELKRKFTYASPLEAFTAAYESLRKITDNI